MPKNHPHIASILYSKEKSHEIFNNCETHKTQLSSLPENDADIARTYWNIGNIHSCYGNHEKANEEWRKALDIASKLLLYLIIE